MSDFKEFQGKTLDAAIADACAYYDAPREKLEIDIVEDAKSGIFGLVGARKARIMARRAQLPDMPRKGRQKNGAGAADTSRLPHGGEQERQPEFTEAGEALAGEAMAAETPAEKGGRTRRGRGRNASSPAEGADPTRAEDASMFSEGEAGEASDAMRRGRPRRQPAHQDARQDEGDGTPREQEGDGRFPPRVKLTELDQDKLRDVAETMLRGLVTPILGDDDFSLEIQVEDERLQARIQCDDTGLLIGRDGQNLAAVQYLATRMITRAMDAQIYLQLDAGDYHSRQDSRLQELALNLADRVRETGKPQATRAMSAYQRRVIHLALQDDPDVQTRSVGEGALKRVIVQRRKD